MSHSPFLLQRMAKLAALSGATVTTAALSEPDPESASGQEYATLRAVLHDNLRKLQDVESHEARIPMKQAFMLEFDPWIAGVLAADKPVQDEILMTNLVWAIDCGEYDLALGLGRFALKHGLALPERYNRTAACFLREEIAEIALAQPGAVPHEILVELDQLTSAADMPDAAKAKLDKALGRSWLAKADAFDASDETGPAGGAAAYASEGLAHLQRAMKLNANIGVKKDIQRAEKLLRDLAPKD